ncbi:MAG TPA: O-methyltransferase [Pirellulaceae bacterium]|nr:O-methyltransferase [Pirellulaceae bacterium]
MPQEKWTAVDEYLAGRYVPADPALDAALEASRAAGLPDIQVSPCQGKLLMLLAQLARAERILEVGTLGGYSTIWLARGLVPGGRLISLELNPQHAAVAQENLARARVADQVEIRIGPAAESLRQLAAENDEPFDLIFLDADKASLPQYLELSLALSRPGTLLIADNVVRKGQVLDPHSPDPDVQGVRLFHERLATHPRVNGTALQTVGLKGHDGLAIALVTG